jgi:hypothetical protein
MPSVQIVNQPNLYANNAKVSNNATTPNTQLDVSAGQVRDSLNAYDIVLTAQTIDATINGANGLDTGSLAASTFYYVHAIGDSLNNNAGALLLSLSRTAPTMPAGYDCFRWLGVALTDGSSHFLLMKNTGNGTARTLYWDAGIQVLNAGTQTGSFLAVSCAAAVPPIDATPVMFDVNFIPATAADGVSFRPTGSSATQVDGTTGVVAAKLQQVQMKMLTGLASSVAKIDYQNSAASGSTTLYVCAFDYFI